MKAASIFPNIWISYPLVDLTLPARCKSVFSIKQLNVDSMDCLMEDSALENRSL